MVCSVCQDAAETCENDDCAADLGDTFHCYDGSHFCTVLCWQSWLVKKEIQGLEEAAGKEE